MSGACEKHLRTAHPGLDIVLGSTVQYINIVPGVLHNPDTSTCQDCDYESDPGPAGLESDKFCRHISYESDTEVLDDATSASAGKHIRYKGAGEVIGDIHGFEAKHSNLCEDPWASFNSAQGVKLVSWFIDGKVSKSSINKYFSSGLGNAESVGYSSVHTLDNHLRLLDPYSHYLQWFEEQVEDGQRTLLIFYRDVLECVRYLLHQIAYPDDLIYTPQREYDPTGHRIYGEIHTADWWCDVQV